MVFFLTIKLFRLLIQLNYIPISLILKHKYCCSSKKKITKSKLIVVYSVTEKQLMQLFYFEIEAETIVSKCKSTSAAAFHADQVKQVEANITF